MNNVFPPKSAQNRMASLLAGTELKLFGRDPNWEWCDYTREVVKEVKGKGYAYRIWYDMLGTSEGDWVFAPSMEDKLFYLDGQPMTVERQKRAFNHPYGNEVWEEFVIAPFHRRWDEYQDMEYFN